MILTGKAKEDFDKWNYDNDFGYIDHEPTSLVVHFEDLDDNLRNTIIIDWFDSVGIYINISPRYIGHDLKYSLGDFYAIINFKDLRPTNNGFNYNNIDDTIYNRQEATKQAIIKANEIYNNEH